jgi:hypothetical protein
MLTGNPHRIHPIIGLQCNEAMSAQKIVEQFHVQLIILDDQDRLFHTRASCGTIGKVTLC